MIDAGAGTGKTSTIVDRVIEHYLSSDQRATRLLPVPARPSSTVGGVTIHPASERVNLEEWGGLLPGEVVLLTFTNRAANEMKDRLRQAISRLRPGPIGDDGEIRRDPRIRSQGFVEQLLTLLEDAPIGTIDSFLSQLVTPYRGWLGDALGRENVSDSGRAILVETSLRTIWRLASEKSRIGDAVDAGIPATIAADVLAARDRVARHYSGRTSATRVLRALVSKSVFVEESSRKIIDEEGKLDGDLLRYKILSSIDSKDISTQADRTHAIAHGIRESIKTGLLTPSSPGWPPQTRMASLDDLIVEGPPTDDWGKLLWMAKILMCIVSPSSMYNKKMTFLPRLKLPSGGWESGIRSHADISDKTIKDRFKREMKNHKSELDRIWSDDLGVMVLHFVRISSLLDGAKPPHTPPDWGPPSLPLAKEIPERPEDPKKNYHFSLESEIQNLRDLQLLHQGFQGVLKNLKLRNEVHDFDDIQRMAGDLLLTNCPEVCRAFYHPTVQQALDSLETSPWRDDHIISALEAIKRLEENPNSAGHSQASLGAMRADLEARYSILGDIRRRFRAFIIDEAQDNSPLQWRLLSRLWGPRQEKEGDPVKPDTPWQPTVCYVGDVKQSIYAFRQAEVTGFLEFARSLRAINAHEFSSIAELTSQPPLRKETHSRDPRNDHISTIATATEHMERGGRDLASWIPFDSTDWDLPAPSADEVRSRKEGMVSLHVNYRTEGGLLDTMNEWWEDVFSDRHRILAKGDFYASAQTLHSFPEKRTLNGSIEWICPPDSNVSEDPSKNLEEYLDPFGPGPSDSIERQSRLIAQRVRSLIDGNAVRVRSADGSWKIAPQENAVNPEEISILMPNRVGLRDVIVRHLADMGVPSQVDREGGLLDRPAVKALEGLIQFVARPKSRHNAAWVSRSTLLGLNDRQLHSFLSSKPDEENLLKGLLGHCVGDRQRSMVSRWVELSSQSRIVELLEETIDNSDLLVAYPDETSRQDVEHFVDLVRIMSKEVGGDAIVLSDQLRELADSNSQSLEASTTPSGEAVRVMTIHSSKGLEAKVVILADLFSPRQTNMRNEQNSRLIVSPEMFAGHPNPWPSEKSTPKSALWNHVSLLHRARKNAEARRLLYVGATRAEQKLIISGSPKGTIWHDQTGINVPLAYDKSAPQLGQMWLESLRRGSWRRGEDSSPWLDHSKSNKEPELGDSGSINLDPADMMEEAFLGGSGGKGMLIFHDPECFKNPKGTSPSKTPLQKIGEIDNAARSISEPKQKISEPFIEKTTRIRANPSKLPSYFECPTCHWLEVRAGVNTSYPILKSSETKLTEPLLPIDPATFGTIFHRIMEIGIGNPGPGDEGTSIPLPSSWTKKTNDKMADIEIHKTVFNELLPPGADQEAVLNATSSMASKILQGKLGRMVDGGLVDGKKLEGLRTEMPFDISIPLNFETVSRKRWTPEGGEEIAKIESTEIDISGVIDLVLCFRSEDGISSIRSVDLKTEGAESLISEVNHGLLESMGSDDDRPNCDAEVNMLRKHRLQMALYHMALLRTEEEKKRIGMPHREVLPPAILVGLTGRIVEYPEKLLEQAKEDLFKTLERTAMMALPSEFSLSDLEDLTHQPITVCRNCENFCETPITKSP